jgi:hypothetical protein
MTKYGIQALTCWSTEEVKTGKRFTEEELFIAFYDNNNTNLFWGEKKIYFVAKDLQVKNPHC